MMAPPTNSADGELPAHQHDEDDAELEHQVGRGEHEDRRGHEVRTFDEQRLRHGRRRVRAGRRDHAVAAGPGDRGGPVVAHLLLHRLPGDERLDGPGEAEAQDQRPQGLPEHEEALAEAAADVGEHGDGSRPACRSRPHQPGDGGRRLGQLGLRLVPAGRGPRRPRSGPGGRRGAGGPRTAGPTWRPRSARGCRCSTGPPRPCRWRPRTWPSMRRRRFSTWSLSSV